MAALPPSDNSGLVKDVLLVLLTTPEGNGKEQVIDVFRQLTHRNLCAAYDIDDEDDLESYLRKYPQVFDVRGRGRNILVSPNINLSICPEHSKKVGSCPEGTCANLHFCIFYLLSGRCSYKDRCLFGHKLETDHNLRLLKKHLLGDLNMTELRTLLCLPWMRRGVTVPRVCRYYNVRIGCSKGQTCRSVHMCRPYIFEKCTFGRKCKRNHDINHPQVTQVLTLYGVKVTGRPLKNILEEVRIYEKQHDDDHDTDMGVAAGAGAIPKRYGSVPNLFQRSELSLAPQSKGSRQRCPSETRRPRNLTESSYGALTRAHAAKRNLEDICLYHLMGNCRFGDGCNRLHSSEPFLWRFTTRNEIEVGQEVTWFSLDSENNLLLERNFCQPHITECTVDNIDGSQMKVNFRHFIAENSEKKLEYRVERLSTPSHVDTRIRSSFVQYSTVWLWYWRDGDGQWHEFGFEVGEGKHLPLGSDAVEKNYLSCGSTLLKLDHFDLNFRKMRLKDCDTGCKFKVRRRPQFRLRNERSESEDGSIHTSSDEDDASNASDDVKSDEEAQKVDIHTLLVLTDEFLTLLNPSSKQYNQVRGPFCGTVGRAVHIISIHKVENRHMETAYNRKKKSMSKVSNRKAIAERTLYYGPEPNEDIAAICRDGINCIVGGANTNDKPLGKGGYFHVNAARTNMSSAGLEDGEHHVFVVKCLTGAWGKGSPMLVSPPSVDPCQPLGKRFDSYADDVHNPKTFVIFDKTQVCPKYLITYRLA